MTPVGDRPVGARRTIGVTFLCATAVVAGLAPLPPVHGQPASSPEAVTGLPGDITSRLSLAGIWQAVADRDATAQNHGQAVDFAGNLRLHNGREGVVMAGWSFAGFANTLPTIVPVNIAMFEQQDDGTLRLSTSRYVTNPSTNGAGSVVVADFNRDGIDDVFLAAWNEAPNIPASSTAFLSNRSSYDRVSVNDLILAHGANFAEINGVPTVFTATFGAGPGVSNTVAAFDGAGNFTVMPDTGVGNNSSVAVADFYGTGVYSAVYGDFSYGPNYRYQADKVRGIYLYNLVDRRPTGVPFNVGTPYFDEKPRYSGYPSFWDPQKTHTIRVWTDDFNQDKKIDIVTEGQIWHASSGPLKNIFQMFRNDGNYAFTDVTDAANPDYSESCYQHEYQPQLRDVDGSGIATYLIGSPSYKPNQPACNYVLVNDGTGRFHVALHETLNTYGQQVLQWIAAHRDFAGYSAQSPPQMRAYRTANGLLNFVAIVPVTVQRGSEPYLSRFVFVNVPLQLDLAKQFTRPMTIRDQNGSRRIRTFAGDDTIHIQTATGATIDGGLGTNTVVYSRQQQRYHVTKGTNGAWQVKDPGLDRTDTLIRVQQIRFDGPEPGTSAPK